MKSLARVLLYLMNVGVILLGLAGLVAPDFDLSQQLNIKSLGSLTPADHTALLVHWRYLKGYPIGLGLFGFWKREAILNPGPDATANTLYIGTLALAALGRVLGILFDGRPPALILYVFAPFEIITPILLWLGTRRRAEGR